MLPCARCRSPGDHGRWRSDRRGRRSRPWRRGRSAPHAISRRPLTGASLTLHGRPQGWSRPQPRTAPCRAISGPACRPNARRQAVYLRPPRRRLVPLAPRQRRLPLHRPGSRPPDPSRRPGSIDAMPFFAVTMEGRKPRRQRQLGGRSCLARSASCCDCAPAGLSNVAAVGPVRSDTALRARLAERCGARTQEATSISVTSLNPNAGRMERPNGGLLSLSRKGFYRQKKSAADPRPFCSNFLTALVRRRYFRSNDGSASGSALRLSRVRRRAACKPPGRRPAFTKSVSECPCHLVILVVILRDSPPKDSRARAQKCARVWQLTSR